MASRKTFEVRKLVENINYRLKHSKCSDAERMSMVSVLEFVLHETGNYAGYGHLSPAGTPDHNESRREYFLHRGL